LPAEDFENKTSAIDGPCSKEENTHITPRLILPKPSLLFPYGGQEINMVNSLNYSPAFNGFSNLEPNQPYLTTYQAPENKFSFLKRDANSDFSPQSSQNTKKPRKYTKRTNSKAPTYQKKTVSVQAEFKKFVTFGEGFKPSNIFSLVSALESFPEQPLVENWVNTVIELLEDRKKATLESNHVIIEIYQFMITSLNNIKASSLQNKPEKESISLSTEAQEVIHQLIAHVQSYVPTDKCYADHFGRKLTCLYLEKEKIVPEGTFGVLRASADSVKIEKDSHYLQTMAKPGYNNFNLTVPLLCKFKKSTNNV